MLRVAKLSVTFLKSPGMEEVCEVLLSTSTTLRNEAEFLEKQRELGSKCLKIRGNLCIVFEEVSVSLFQKSFNLNSLGLALTLS